MVRGLPERTQPGVRSPGPFTKQLCGLRQLVSLPRIPLHPLFDLCNMAGLD